MSPGFLVAAVAGAFGTGLIATLLCRDRSYFLLNVLAAAAGAFALTVAVAQIGVGYADFGMDLATGLVFAVVGGLVALLFAAMARDLATSEPQFARAPMNSPRPALAPKSPVRSQSARMNPGKTSEQELACAEFQHFLRGEGETLSPDLRAIP